MSDKPLSYYMAESDYIDGPATGGGEMTYEITLVFDPKDAEEDDSTDLGTVQRLAEYLNVETARLSSAYQGYRVGEAVDHGTRTS